MPSAEPTNRGDPSIPPSTTRESSDSEIARNETAPDSKPGNLSPSPVDQEQADDFHQPIIPGGGSVKTGDTSTVKGLFIFDLEMSTGKDT